MNRVFRSIWSALREQWVCVAETATAHGRAQRSHRTSRLIRLTGTSTPTRPTFSRPALTVALTLVWGAFSPLSATAQALDLESGADPNDLYGTIRSGIHDLIYPLGNVYYDGNIEAERQRPHLRIRDKASFQLVSLTGNPNATLEPFTSPTVDGDALAKIAGNGREVNAIEHVIVRPNSFTLINPVENTSNTFFEVFPLYRDEESPIAILYGLGIPTPLLTFHLQSSLESPRYWMDTPAVVKTDGGETLDLRLQFNFLRSVPMFYAAKNAVVIMGNRVPPAFPVGFEDPKRVFAPGGLHWLGENTSQLYLGITEDITLEASDVNRLGILYLKAGTTRFSGTLSPSKGIWVDSLATLEITGDSSLNLTNVGLVKFLSGNIHLNINVDFHHFTFARYYIPDTSVTLTGPTQSNGNAILTTPVTDLTALNRYIDVLGIRSLETLSPITELPSRLWAVSTYPHWIASADSTVSRYTPYVSVSPGVSVTLLGDSSTPFTLINEGRATVKDGNISQIDYWGTSPTSVLTLTNTTIPIGNLHLDTLNQLHVNSVASNSATSKWAISTQTLGEQPDWWNSPWWSNLAAQSTLTVAKLTDADFAWLASAQNLPKAVTVDKATLTRWPTFGAPFSTIAMNELTLNGGPSTFNVPVTLEKQLALASGVTLTLAAPLTLMPGARIDLASNAQIERATDSLLVFGAETPPPKEPKLTVRLPGQALVQGVDPTPFLTPDQKTHTLLETTEALENVNLSLVEPYYTWHLLGDVTGLKSAVNTDGVDPGLIRVPVEVGRVARLTAPELTVKDTLTVFGNVETHTLTLGDPETETSAEQAATLTVRAGGTLALNGSLTVNRPSSNQLIIAPGGLLKAAPETLVKTDATGQFQVLVNTQSDSDPSQPRQTGIWIPSFHADQRYDLTAPSLMALAQHFDTLSIPTGTTVLLAGEHNPYTYVDPGATLEIPQASVIRKELEVKGTLRLRAPLTFEHTDPQTPWLSKLILHESSQVETEGEGKFVWKGATLESDAPHLVRGDSQSPAWLGLVEDAVRESTAPSTLVTTGASQTVDPQAFSRWEVRSTEARAQAIAPETYIYAGKTLRLTVPKFESGVIRNFGTLVLTTSQVTANDTQRIEGGGHVELYARETTTFEGEHQYVGHTTLKSGQMRLKKYAALQGNLTLESGTRLLLPASGDTPQPSRSTLGSTGITHRVNALELKRGSVVQVELNSLEHYTRLFVPSDLQIDEGARLEVKYSPEVLNLPLNTVFPGVIRYWDGMTGRFLSDRTVLPNIAFEAENTDVLDFEILYPASDALPEDRAIGLKLVNNNERLPEPPPADNQSPAPTPDEPDQSEEPQKEPQQTSNPIVTVVPVVAERAPEQPLLSGTAKVSLASLTGNLNNARLMQDRLLNERGDAFWVSLIGNAERLAGQHPVLGFKADHQGLAMGHEVTTGSQGNLRLGIAGLAATGDMKATENTATDTVSHDVSASTWLVGLYGELDVTEKLTLDVGVSAGRSRLKGERQFGAEGLTAKSRTHASLYEAGVGVTWKATDAIKPFARLDYTRVSVQGFTESGANEHNQHVSRDHVDELVAQVGAVVSTPLSQPFTASVRVSAGVDLLDGIATTHARFVDGGGEIAVKNTARSRVVGDLAVGLTYQVTPNWSLSTSISGEARRHQREGAIDLRSMWTF